MREVTSSAKRWLLSVLRWESSVAVAALILVSAFFLVLYSISNEYSHVFLPNTIISGINVGNTTPEDAISLLQASHPEPESFEVSLRVDDITVASSSADLEYRIPVEQTVKSVFAAQNSSHAWLRIPELMSRSIKSERHALHPQYNLEKINTLVALLKQKVDIEGVEPHATLEKNGVQASIEISPGSIGRMIVVDETIARVEQALIHPSTDSAVVIAQVSSTSSQLTDEEVVAAKQRASAFVNARIALTNEETRMEVSDQDLVNLLAFPSGYKETAIHDLLEEKSVSLYSEPVDAEFLLSEDGKRVEKFAAHRDGVSVDVAVLHPQFLQYVQNIETATDSAQKNIEGTLPLKKVAPSVTLETTNSLGINERIGFGESWYAGSIPTRVHNVSLTSERINNTIVAPGEEFSFNKTLGDVSRATGFQPAYVIRSGKTELGDGGGVCQVSSTLFRALLDSGLSITRRLQHSYRVGYYEQNSEPGFDATVYSGNVDLRFINDTEHHVLVHTRLNEADRYLAVEIYGTSDGRTTEISDYRKWGMQAAPPPEYYPDSSLAPGQLKQIDWAVAGIRTTFLHTIKDKDGSVLSQKEYVSNYRPWSAKYLQGM